MAETPEKPSENKLSVTPKKTVTLAGRGVEQGVVRQSFSHGRTRTIVVEKKSGAPSQSKPKPELVADSPPTGIHARPAPKTADMVLRPLTDEERLARARALQDMGKPQIGAGATRHSTSSAKDPAPVDSDDVNRFYSSIDRATRLKETELIDFFVYYLTVDMGKPAANADAIVKCFKACDLTPPTSTSQYLSRGLKSTPQKFIRVDGGYKLERHRRELISRRLGAETIVVQTSAELRQLESTPTSEPQREFLKETIACFETGANRAAIIMCWILVMDHLFELVLGKHLVAFNAELAKVTDKRVKVSAVSTRDDFGDIPEQKFIELLRTSGIISKDVRKILDERLGTRNSCAHASSVTVSKIKVIDFVQDLVVNVILKYPI